MRPERGACENEDEVRAIVLSKFQMDGSSLRSDKPQGVKWAEGPGRAGWRRGRSSVGRAADLHSAGHRFEPVRLHHLEGS